MVPIIVSSQYLPKYVDAPLIFDMTSTGISRMYEGLFDERVIYISDYIAAKDFSLLRSLNITAVVSVAKETHQNYPSSLVSEHLCIPAVDSEDYHLQYVFDKTFEFIERVLHQCRNVLIHCAMGISRSPTIFIAYLIRKHGYSLPSALSIAKRKRPIINPNKGFMKALEGYSQKYCAVEKSVGRLNHRVDKNRSASKSQRLTKKSSFTQDTKLQDVMVLLEYEQKQQTSPSELRQKQEGEKKLARVLEHKERVEQKLRSIQSYYKERQSLRSRFAQTKFRSCFQSKQTVAELQRRNHIFSVEL